jgi:hypothetical protein
MLETPFWRKAAGSLPPHVRERYATYLEAAERWDLALDAAIDAAAALRRTLRGWSRHVIRRRLRNARVSGR